MSHYYKWFDFAEKTKNPFNKESDFVSFKDEPIFIKVMEKLKTTTLEEDDFQYIEDRVEYENIVAAFNEKIRQDATREGRQEGRQEGYIQARNEFQPIVFKLQQAEKEKQQVEKSLIATIKKCLKRGDTLEEISDFLEMDMLSLQFFVNQIEKD